MKHLTLILAALLLLASCAKEGKPTHKHKIAQIYSGKTVVYTESGVPAYTLSRQLVEEWQWDGNELFRIDYSEDDATYSENFFYNWRHQIVRTTVPAYDLESQFLYSQGHLMKIDVTLKGQALYSIEFIRDKKHVTQIELVGSVDEASALHPRLLSHSVGPDVAQAISQSLAHNPSSKSETHLALTWLDDDLAEISDGQGHTIRYTYGTQANPLRQLYSLYALDNEVGNLDLSLLSKHVLAQKEETLAGKTSSTTYQFVGDKYPTSCNVVTTFETMSSDNQLVSLTSTEQREFIYQ